MNRYKAKEMKKIAKPLARSNGKVLKMHGWIN